MRESGAVLALILQFRALKFRAFEVRLNLGADARRDYHLHGPLHGTAVHLPARSDHSFDRVLAPLVRLQPNRNEYRTLAYVDSIIESCCYLIWHNNLTAVISYITLRIFANAQT